MKVTASYLKKSPAVRKKELAHIINVSRSKQSLDSLISDFTTLKTTFPQYREQIDEDINVVSKHRNSEFPLERTFSAPRIYKTPSKHMATTKGGGLFSPIRGDKIVRNMRPGFIDLGACGRGGALTKKEKIEQLGLTDKFRKLDELEKLKTLQKVDFIVSEQNIIDSFYTSEESGILRGRANQIREDFVCASLYQISKKITPSYKNSKVIGLFNQLKNEVSRQKLDMVDALPAGGGGESHDVKILLRGNTSYSTLELKTTQQKCKDPRMPWSCTQQFQSKLLMSSHRIRTKEAKNDGELYLKGWYNILKQMDGKGELFTPPGQLPTYQDFIVEVNQTLPKKKFWQYYFKGMQMKKIYLKKWSTEGIPGMTVEEKTMKMKKIDEANHKYTNSFLKKHKNDIIMDQIQVELKKIMAGKNFWLTWSAADNKFSLYKGSPTVYISDSSLEYIDSPSDVNYGYYLITVHGLYIDEKPLNAYVALRLQWSNRITQPAWRFSYLKDKKKDFDAGDDEHNAAVIKIKQTKYPKRKTLESSSKRKILELSSKRKTPELTPKRKTPELTPKRKILELSSKRKTSELTPKRKTPEPSPRRKIPEPSPKRTIPSNIKGVKKYVQTKLKF